MMPEVPREWKYLERRPGSSYQQLSVKRTRIWARTFYREIIEQRELRTPQELANDWRIPLEAVEEAIVYGQSDPPEVREHHRRDELLAEAIGMNDKAIRQSGRPRPLTTEERVRLGL